MEHNKKTTVAEVTGELCTLEFVDMFPLDRASGDYDAPEDVCPLLDIKVEDIQDTDQESAGEYDADVKQEPADDCNAEDPCLTIQVQVIMTLLSLCISFWFRIQGRLHHRKLGANAPKNFRGGRFDVEPGGGNVFEKKYLQTSCCYFFWLF